MTDRHPFDETILPRRRIIRTVHAERMREYLLETFKVSSFRTARDADRFGAQANRIQLEHIGFDYCAYDSEVNIEFPPADWFRQTIGLSGSGRMRIGRAEFPLSPENTWAASAGALVKFDYGAGYRHLILRFNADSVRQKIENLAGISTSKPLQINPNAKPAFANIDILRSLALNYAVNIDSPQINNSNLVIKELEQTMLVAFLCGNNHNYSFVLDKPALNASPKQVRLVESYIEANWNKPISIDEIAEITGVAVRSIFQVFKETRGYSPMAFAKKLRLERAREMLLRAEAGVSVTEVAFQCGFLSHGHFSRGYRQRFGELPSQTLTRSYKEKTTR